MAAGIAIHAQKRGFTKFSVFLKRVSLLNPPVRTNSVAFPLERTTRKSLEVRFDFGPRPGFSKQLFGSSREGTELDWTCFQKYQFEGGCWDLRVVLLLGIFPTEREKTSGSKSAKKNSGAQIAQHP